MTFKRFAYLGGAALCFTSALLILSMAGLPQRSSYSGLLIAGTTIAPEVGAVAPNFVSLLLDDTSLELHKLRGDIVILNFWATWCVPCQAEMPELEQLYQAYRSSGVRIVAVNIGEERSPIAEWVTTLDLSFDIAFDREMIISQMYQLRGQPITFIIDQQGLIRHIFFGATHYAALEASIAPLLAQNS